MLAHHDVRSDKLVYDHRIGFDWTCSALMCHECAATQPRLVLGCPSNVPARHAGDACQPIAKQGLSAALLMPTPCCARTPGLQK